MQKNLNDLFDTNAKLKGSTYAFRLSNINNLFYVIAIQRFEIEGKEAIAISRQVDF
jgi:hypothetical protein